MPTAPKVTARKTSPAASQELDGTFTSAHGRAGGRPG